MVENGNVNGNGRIKQWQAWVAMALSLMALGKAVFFAGGDIARIEEHLKYDDERITETRRQQERDEEKFQPEIDMMRSVLTEQKQSVEQQQRLISELEDQLRKKR